jgi:hypothetical protein
MLSLKLNIARELNIDDLPQMLLKICIFESGLCGLPFLLPRL